MHRENAKLLSFNYHTVESSLFVGILYSVLRLSVLLCRCRALLLHSTLASTGAVLFYGKLYSYFVFCAFQRFVVFNGLPHGN